jgi:hypothetical protein
MPLRLNPFDPRLDDLFQGKEAEWWTRWRDSDHKFRSVVRLSIDSLPAAFYFAPYMQMPPFWSETEDYTMTVSVALWGQLERVWRSPILPFVRIDPVLLPSREKFVIRLRLIQTELPLLMTRRPIPHEAQFRPPPAWVKSNREIVWTKHSLTRAEQMRMLRVLYLFGIPESNAIRKLTKISQFTHVHDKALEDWLNSFLDIAIIWDVTLEKFRTGPGKVDLWWVPVCRMADVVKSVSVLSSVRELLPWLRTVKGPFPRWTEAPEWWTDPMDQVLVKLSAYYGFLYFSEFIRFLPMDTNPVKEQHIEKWKLTELRTLTPKNEKCGHYLSFLFPIPARIHRLEDILRYVRSGPVSRM